MQFNPDDKKIKGMFKKVRNIERIKEEGNAFFKQKKYEEAHEKYTEALDLSKYNKFINAILYCNRAQSLLKMDKSAEALADYNKAIE